MIRLYNTKTLQIEEFKPIHEGHVDMYVCGPTVYNYAHIGNARPMIVFDVLKRLFEAEGYSVTYVSNFTDVDDKIIKKAAEENTTEAVIAQRYIDAYQEVRTLLNTELPDITPRVTETMDKIIDFIDQLVKTGHAYEANGDVYFSVESVPTYGEISHQHMDQLEAGARIETNDQKKNPYDFALWKKTDMGIKWNSPWGEGRPGWHTECVVMINDNIGDCIDIHGGGSDLVFPHHENETAQASCAWHAPLANYWMHTGMLRVDGEKMSKSLGNFITVHDALKTIDGQVLRFFFATQHYRKPINFTEKAVRDAETNLKYLKNTYEQPFTGNVDAQELQAFKDKFVAAMDEDFNSANGITVVFEMAKWINSGNYDAAVKQALAAMLEVFGIVFVEEVLDEEIETLIQKRQEARANRDFATADQIRDQLAAQGIKLLDTKDGVRWTRD